MHRFLNRESSYSKLLVSIEEYERKVSELKKNHEMLTDRLRELRSDPALEKQDKISSQVKHEIDDLQDQ